MINAAGIARKWWRAWAGVCLIITGTPALVACYGPPYIPPQPHDPSVELTDFTYEPASPIKLGDSLVFRLSANKPTTAGDAVHSEGDHHRVPKRDLVSNLLVIQAALKLRGYSLYEMAMADFIGGDPDVFLIRFIPFVAVFLIRTVAKTLDD